MKSERKMKWWLIPILLIVTVAVVAALFWDSLSMYLAPKTALRSALNHTWETLEERFRGSPLLLLGNALQEDGLNTWQMELTTTDDLLGEVRYHMTAQTQMAPKRILAKGTALTGGTTLDLSLYLDDTFAAVSSDSLLSSNYYGITYDTFPQEIRSNAILAFVLGQDTIAELEASVASLQETMSGDIVIPRIPEEDIRTALMGIYALKAQVTKESLTLTGGEQECFCVSFQATGEEILKAAELAQMELPFVLEASSVLKASFYLLENTVVECRMDLNGGEEDAHIVLMPNRNPATDGILLQVELPELAFTAVVSTICSEDTYTEQLLISQPSGGEATIWYSWESDGDLQLSRKDAASEWSVSASLTETEDGFRLETGDIDGVLAILTDHEDEADNPCTLTVGKGEAFVTPDYKNFDQWSLEDILSLFGSIGGLLGLGAV